MPNSITIILRLSAIGLTQQGRALEAWANKMQGTFQQIGTAGRWAFVGTSVALGFATKEFAQSTIAAAKLEDAFSRAGDASGMYKQQIETLADELRDMLGLQDETTKELAAMAASMGAPAASIGKLVKDAISLSEVAGIGLPQALKFSVGAGEELYDLLGRMNPRIRAAKDEQEKAAIVQAMLANGWQQAQARANTFGGTLERLKAASSESAEALGGAVAPAVQFVSEKLIAANKAFQEWTATNGVFAGAAALSVYGISAMASVLPQLGMALLGVSKLMQFFGVTGTANIFKVLAAMRAFSLGTVAFLVTPLGLVVAAVAAAALAFTAYKNKAAAMAAANEGLINSQIAARSSFEKWQEAHNERGTSKNVGAIQKEIDALNQAVEAQEAAAAAARKRASERTWADRGMKGFDDSTIATAEGTLDVLKRERDKLAGLLTEQMRKPENRVKSDAEKKYDEALAAAKLAADQAGKTAEEQLRLKLVADGLTQAQIGQIVAYQRVQEAAEKSAEAKKKADEDEIARKEKIKDKLGEIKDATDKARGVASEVIDLRGLIGGGTRRELGDAVNVAAQQRQLTVLEGMKTIAEKQAELTKFQNDRADQRAVEQANALAEAYARTEDVGTMIARVQADVLREPFKQQADQIQYLKRMNELQADVNKATLELNGTLKQIDTFIRENAAKARFALA